MGRDWCMPLGNKTLDRTPTRVWSRCGGSPVKDGVQDLQCTVRQQFEVSRGPSTNSSSLSVCHAADCLSPQVGCKRTDLKCREAWFHPSQ